MRARRLTFLLALVAAFAAIPQARADVRFLPLEDCIRHSAWIAVVEVTSVKPQARDSRYSRLATLRVTLGISGVKEGDTIALDYDNGFLCPNAPYSKGERCLIFAERRTDGCFATMWDYWGKASIKGQDVDSPYPQLCGDLDKVVHRINAILKSNERK